MEEYIQGGDRKVYQEFFQKLQREKHLSEQDKAYLKEKKPELYKMVESLEQEIETYKEKLNNCGSKEEVQELKESYEDGLLLGISLVESNPELPLEKKLEYTMFKDTKLSIMEEVIGEFEKSARYEGLPNAVESAEETDEDENEAKDEELELQKIKRAKAVSSYAYSRSTADARAQEPSPFDTKG